MLFLTFAAIGSYDTMNKKSNLFLKSFNSVS